LFSVLQFLDKTSNGRTATAHRNIITSYPMTHHHKARLSSTVMGFPSRRLSLPAAVYGPDPDTLGFLVRLSRKPLIYW
jgi:hypothetical protein